MSDINNNTTFTDHCSALAEPIGDATGAVYGGMALAYGTVEAAPTMVANPNAAPAIMTVVEQGANAVNNVIGGFVTENFPHSCELMADIGDTAVHAGNSLSDYVSHTFGDAANDGAAGSD